MEATVAREERVGKARRRRKCAVNALGEHEKEKALHRNCAKKRTEEETCARDSAGGGSTVEETCARDSAQAAEVRSQRTWCGGEGDCVRKRAGSSAEEARICVEERAFRAR